MLPLVGVSAAVDQRLRAAPLDELHPALARAVRARAPAEAAAAKAASQVALTDRERSLLEILPTHLTYAEIGARLFLSVNTVKTNLKSLYRKLGATTAPKPWTPPAGSG